jgi:hypothetical protein
MADRKMIDEITLFGRRGKSVRILTGAATPYDIALSLQQRAYISHHSAAYLHGLITSESPLIFFSVESNYSEPSENEIDQGKIDRAFELPQRRSKNIYHWNGLDFLALTSLNVNSKGISKKNGYLATEIERTLLDLTVRPSYGGGSQEVMKMYKKGLLTGMSVERLIDLYDLMGYRYPYNQAIGFYLEMNGYAGKLLNELAKLPKPFTFYLDYEMQQTAFSEKWNLYYPKELSI